MKKAISILAIAVLMVSMLSVTAFAHGGHGNGYRAGTQQQPCHELCTEDGCDVVGPHQHDGVWYCNQTVNCADYGVCTVEGCTEIGLHEHTGSITIAPTTVQGTGAEDGRTSKLKG